LAHASLAPSGRRAAIISSRDAECSELAIALPPGPRPYLRPKQQILDPFVAREPKAAIDLPARPTDVHPHSARKRPLGSQIQSTGFLFCGVIFFSVVRLFESTKNHRFQKEFAIREPPVLILYQIRTKQQLLPVISKTVMNQWRFMKEPAINLRFKFPNSFHSQRLKNACFMYLTF
jgi:hypothetical protein